MPKTVTLSDSELAILQAIRQVVGDVLHPARPAAIALCDRIASLPVDGPRFPVHTRSGSQPLDLSDPDGYGVEVGDPEQRRAVWRLRFQAFTRPVR